MLTIYDEHGPLGTITMAGDRLVASTPSLQSMADGRVRAKGSAAAAYADILGRSNGYTWARET